MADGLYDAVVGATTLRRCTQASASPNLEKLLARYSGAVSPDDAFIISADANASFETFDLKGVLNSMSLTGGLFVTSGSVVIPYRKRSPGGTYAAINSSVHTTASGSKALAIPTAFNFPSKGAASVSVQVIFLTPDGVAAGMVLNVNQTLTAQSGCNVYGLGPVALDGVGLAKINSVTINTGINVERVNHNGSVWPDEVFITTVEPTIVLNTDDLALIGAYDGGGLLATGLELGIRRRTSGGTYYDDTSAQHVKFTCASGIVTPNDLSADGTSLASTGLTISGLGATAIAFAVDAALAEA